MYIYLSLTMRNICYLSLYYIYNLWTCSLFTSLQFCLNVPDRKNRLERKNIQKETKKGALHTDFVFLEHFQKRTIMRILFIKNYDLI